MTIISRYLSRELVISILLVTLALLSMFFFIDLIQQLDSFGKGAYGIGKMLLFVLLSAPGHVYEIIPMAVLIGTLYTLGQFSRYSEMVILRVSGISMLSLGLILLRVGLVFTLLTFLVGELVTPLSERSAQRMRIMATDSVVATDFRSGLWAKDGNSFVNIEDVLPDSKLLNVHIYEFDQNFHLRVITNAKNGAFKQDRWDLREVSQTRFGTQDIHTEFFPQAYWLSVIRPELLGVLLVVPEKMSAWNLYSYIEHLSNNRQKTTRYQIALWSKMTYPMACMVMMVLALPFGFFQQRSGGLGAKIFAGIMLGISYQVLNRVFVHLGLLNDWPPPVSAMLPTLLYLAAGIGMALWVERR